LTILPDAIYGHFWRTGFVGYNFAKRHHLPLFVATGESVIPISNSTKDIQEFTDYVRGVICVSSKSKNESMARGLLRKQKYIVAPNSIDNNLFKYRDKYEARKILNYDADDFIVAFVGTFCSRKGTLRLNQALKNLGNRRIKAIFLGSGSEEPDYEGILFKGCLNHRQIPIYLQASDVFVLPTQNEGCCNAIVEAMACGLPIISSDGEFNDDILDQSNSIRVNPDSVEEIGDAIDRLYNNRTLLAELSDGSLLKARHLTIEQRAEIILRFIQGAI
jgi:glycosyltransferase involved in cell wall biosynthesis